MPARGGASLGGDRLLPSRRARAGMRTSRTTSTTPTPPSMQRCSGSRLNRRCTSTEIATAASTSRSSPTPRRRPRPGLSNGGHRRRRPLPTCRASRRRERADPRVDSVLETLSGLGGKGAPSASYGSWGPLSPTRSQQPGPGFSDKANRKRPRGWPLPEAEVGASFPECRPCRRRAAFAERLRRLRAAALHFCDVAPAPMPDAFLFPASTDPNENRELAVEPACSWPRVLGRTGGRRRSGVFPQ